jgi:hypothetical protein
MDQGEIQPGDLYVAERNTGPQLLTAREVNREFNCIYPTEPAYAYDIWECVKVREATEYETLEDCPEVICDSKLFSDGSCMDYGCPRSASPWMRTTY